MNSTPTGLPTWIEQGPGNIAADRLTDTVPGSVGAVNEVDFPLEQPNILFAATVNGGVWRSQDGGGTWEPLTDEFPSLSIGATGAPTLPNSSSGCRPEPRRWSTIDCSPAQRCPPSTGS